MTSDASGAQNRQKQRAGAGREGGGGLMGLQQKPLTQPNTAKKAPTSTLKNQKKQRPVREMPGLTSIQTTQKK